MRGAILSVAFATLCYSSSAPDNFLLGRSINSLDDLSDELIFHAFSEAGHPATVPVREWVNGDGVNDQSLYEFDTAEWEEMRASLLEQSGLNESVSALATRQSEDDPPAFFCLNQNTQPKAYTASLSAAAMTVCQGFVLGGEAAGKTQVIRRNVPDIQNRYVIGTFKYAWKIAKWGTSGGCGIAMSIGINEACNKIQDGAQGEQPATSGFNTDSDPEVQAGVSLSRP